MDTADVAQFIREREEKLGGKIRYRTYCTWYARLGHEVREYGILLYTDGRTVAYEDFDRGPTLLGIPIRRTRPKDEEYVKLEVAFPIEDIADMTQVTWSSAAKSASCGKDISKEANAFDRMFRRIVTKLSLKDGTVIFIEPGSHQELAGSIRRFREEG